MGLPQTSKHFVKQVSESSWGLSIYWANQVILTLHLRRFQFDDEGLGVVKAGEETQNVFVGGTNKWSYDAFVNWEFWFPSFPILVYFKVQ